MARYNALTTFNPSNPAFPNVTTYHQSTTGTVYPPEFFTTPWTLQELAFWFLRVKTWNITGSMTIVTPGGSPVTYTGGLSTTFDTLVGTFQGSTASPADEVDLYVNGSFVQHLDSFTAHGDDGTDLDIDYTIEMSVQFILHQANPDNTQADWFPTLVTNIGTVTTQSTGGTASPFTFTLNGTDHVLGKAYSRSLNMFAPTPGPFVNTVTGAATITPSVFWEYTDDEGTPLYDTTTGALL